MSTERIKHELELFLLRPESEVLCLKGKWGIGKTYWWNQSLTEIQSSQPIARDTYAYVSLFGVQTLEQLKYAIFENTIRSKDVGTEVSIKTLKSNAANLSEQLGRKSLRYLEYIPYAKSFSGGLQSAAYLSISNRLICIDDLERRGSGLRLKDILGLVSQLKERRGCKVILIFNEGALDPSDAREFREYAEKVIDISIEFAPSAEEAATVAIKGEDVKNRLLREHCIKLGILNVRIIKGIERIVDRIAPLTAKFDPQVMRQAIQSLVLLGWMTYSGGTEGPSIEFVTTKRGRALYGATEATSDEEKKWTALLDSYGFHRLDEFDLLLLDAIKFGYFDETRITNAATKLDDRIKAAALEGSFSSAWRIYHDSFFDNEDELINALYTSFTRNFRTITPNNASSTISLLKTLGHTEKAQELIDMYISREEDRDFFDLSKYPFADELRDETLRAAFARRFQEFRDERNPADVLRKIAASQGWGRPDIELLKKLSEDDFYRIFHEVNGVDLHSIVDTALRFGQFQGADNEMKVIAANATSALVRIAGESNLNRLRVARYGIGAPN